MFKFVKDFDTGLGYKIRKGVSINAIRENDYVKFSSGALPVVIPIEYVEEYEPQKYSPKKRKPNEIDVRKSSDAKSSARISSDKI